MTAPPAGDGDRIAVVALSGRFPGAEDPEAYWRNLCDGVESIRRFSPAELIAAGQPAGVVGHPRFVPAEAVLAGFDEFDAGYFGISPREAEITDPQHRVCLEVVASLFDAAGCDPAATGPVGVFLASSLSSYLVRNLLAGPELVAELGGFPLLIHNDKDFLPATVSHRLGLTGPSLAVGTSCSSSLVAVHLAVQSLLAYECDLAVAGGASLLVPQPQGYVYREDGIYSPDGHCRPFDAAARGTVGGSGAGAVLLKRESDARRDGDPIRALLIGSAVNNDGARKAGFTAPGVAGQAAVVAEAHAVAGISAETVGYVEAHGTGTQLGDPIEIEALTRAFRRTTGRTSFCRVGSVKGNIGHLDAAAGIAGFVKAALAVEQGVIPASLHLDRPNPAIDFAAGPFTVGDRTREWRQPDGPRRAGVSSFGIGGTNVHVLLEEAPAAPAPVPAAGPVPLVVSAATATALRSVAARAAARLRSAPRADLPGLARTLAGRRPLPVRAAVVADDPAVGADRLAAAPAVAAVVDRPVVFLFPGYGAQFRAMGARLHRQEPAFGRHLDECLDVLAGLGLDLRGPLLDGDELGTDPAVVGPALVAVEWALGRMLTDCGVGPALLLGHSVGEYAAAALAGVLDLPGALRLAAVRGRLLASLPPGGMLAVPQSPEALARHDLDGVTVAVHNAADQTVLAGPAQAVDAAAARLAERGVASRRLPGTTAFHSALVEPVLAAFRAEVGRVELRPARVPLVSSLTGEPAAADAFARPEYWVDQLRRPVRFHPALTEVLADPAAVLVEVGPGGTLTRLAGRHADAGPERVLLRTLPSAEAGAEALRGTLGSLWAAGVRVDWTPVTGAAAPKQPAPPYPFERERYWVDPPRRDAAPPPSGGVPDGLAELLDPAAARAPLPPAAVSPGAADLDRLCAALALRYLRDGGVDVRAGASHTVGSLAAALGVLPGFRRFLEFLLDTAAEAGALRRDGDTVTFLDRGPDPDPAALAREVVEREPGRIGLVELLTWCADHYRQALSSPGVALGVLYPEGRGDLLESTVGATAAPDELAAPVRLLAELVAELRERRPGPLRVLEVGIGGGRLTWSLADRLGPGDEYVGTDVGRLFLDHVAAEAARRGVTGFRTAPLDIGRDPAGQGFAEGAYDLVVGLDVVHATPDVEVSLANLTRLLAPGGVLAVLETTARDRWLSMVWGLSEGWWSYADRWRTTGPLLTGDRWSEVLGRLDLAAHRVLPPDPAARSVLLLGRRAAGVPVPAAGAVPPKRPVLADWVYAAGWARAPAPEPPPPDASRPTGPVLAFVDGPVGEAVADGLAAAQGAEGAGDPEVVVVRRGRATVPSPDGWDLDPDSREGYATLLDDVTREHGWPERIVHLWAADPPLPGPPGAAETLPRAELAQRLGLHSVLQLVQAAGRAGFRPTRLLVVTAGTCDVLGDDLAHPEHATLHAAAKVVPREQPEIDCRVLDLPAGVAPAAAVAPVLAELAAAGGPPVVAYRGRHRWVPRFAPSPLPAVPDGVPALRPGGVYLVCGGLGGIGLVIAEHLASLPATVVLTSRRALAPPERWRELAAAGPDPDDPVPALLARLVAMQEAGGRVVVERADLTSLPAMAGVVDRTVRRFGPITGVVHAAGVADEAGMIQRRSAADTDRAVRAKVLGTLVLDRVLAAGWPEFLLLCSSIGTVLHNLKFGEVGYVAGHEFLNAYAGSRAARGDTGTVAVGWTDFLEAGMWADAQRRLAGRWTVEADAGGIRPDTDLLRGITAAEGIELVRRVLRYRPAAHTVISTQDLDRMLALHDSFTPAAHLQMLDRLRLSGSGHRRRDLTTPYRSPQTAAERAVTPLLESLLGIDGLGADDDFFALGGDSLLALRLLSRMRDELSVEHPITAFLADPTVRALAAAVEAAGAAPAGRQEVWL